MHVGHEGLAGLVDEHRTLPTDRLGDERLLAGRALPQVHDGGVELDELEVGERRTRTQRGCHTVPRRHGRIGRRGVDLAEPAGGEDDRAGPGRADAVDLALPEDVHGRAAHAAVGGAEQVDDEGVLDDLDARVGADGLELGDERAGDLGAGGVPTGVRDPVAVVPALAGQGDLAGVVGVEARPERDELVHPGRALGDEDLDGRLVAEADARDEGVVEVLGR